MLQGVIESKDQEIKLENQKKNEDPPSSRTNLQSESSLDQEQEAEIELENDPNHVLKEKLQRGIDNPVDKIEQLIESKMTRQEV